MHILVTGGAGYIGSHTIVTLLEAGHTVSVIDNLKNSSVEAIRRVQEITGKSVHFYEFDLCDRDQLDTIFASNTFDAVIHFAGLKAVGESVEKPLLYYRNNIDSTLSLLEVMAHHNVHKLVFSSSATVYGNPTDLPINEKSPVGIGLTNPYGKTKYFIEEILRDSAAADPLLSVTILRYFNPIGAHSSGRIGEDPQGIPNNLVPYVMQVAVGKHSSVKVFGNDYDTPDGTGVRDYIHVVDLAQGHLAALNHMKEGIATYNLGTGSGTSVLEIITIASSVVGREIPCDIVARRQGDIASCYASATKAAAELDWHTTLSVQQAIADSWRWQSQNPNGYNA